MVLPPLLLGIKGGRHNSPVRGRLAPKFGDLFNQILFLQKSAFGKNGYLITSHQMIQHSNINDLLDTLEHVGQFNILVTEQEGCEQG